MNVSATVALDLFASVILVCLFIIFKGSRRWNGNTFYVMGILITIIGMCACDAITALFTGLAGDEAHNVLVGTKTIHLLLTSLVVWLWVMYNSQLVWTLRKKWRPIHVIHLTILLVNAILTLGNLFTPLVFSYDSVGIMKVNLAGMWILTGLNYMSVFASIVHSIIYRDKLRNGVLLPLILFNIPPILAEVYMLFDRTISLTCAYAISAVLVLRIFSDSLTYEDQKTGLGNRRLLYDRAARLFNIPGSRRICGIIITLDNLPKLNELGGRSLGDKALDELAQMLDAFRQDDIEAMRSAGDEFILVWSRPTVDDVDTVMRSVEIELRKLNAGRPVERKLECTLGGYSCSNSQGSPDEFFAMLGTRRGRRVRHMERIITEALEDNLFSVAFQPLWNTREKRFTCAEALVRLNDDELGSYSPSVLIPAAEECGLIDRIDEFVFRQVCAFVASPEFKESGLERVGINLSPRDTRKPSLVKEIFTIMDEYGVSPECITIEITESDIIRDDPELIEGLHRLSEAGLHLCLDDYGSGYSSLRRVTAFPFTVVKLDKSLAQAISDPKLRILLNGTISTLHELGIEIVAEGVENEIQDRMFINTNVKYIQGFRYARPMSRDSLLELLQQAKNLNLN